MLHADMFMAWVATRFSGSDHERRPLCRRRRCRDAIATVSPEVDFSLRESLHLTSVQIAFFALRRNSGCRGTLRTASHRESQFKISYERTLCGECHAD